MTPVSPTQRIVGSYSFFNELENCPFKAYETRVARSIQFIETDASRWGNYVHDAMEKRIGNKKPLPEDVAELETYAAVFDNRAVEAELKLCIDTKGNATKWYGPGAFLAGKIDVTLCHRVDRFDFTDWKTGKDKHENPFELEVHALLHAARIAPIKATYTGRFVYVGRDRLPDKIGQTYDLSDIGRTWSKVVRLMSEAYEYQAKGYWPKRPNPLCGWCQVHKCEHNTEKQRLAKEAANG